MIYDEAEEKKERRNSFKAIFIFIIAIFGMIAVDAQYLKAKLLSFSSFDMIIYLLGLYLFAFIILSLIIRILRMEDTNEEIEEKKMRRYIKEKYKLAKRRYEMKDLENRYNRLKKLEDKE